MSDIDDMTALLKRWGVEYSHDKAVSDGQNYPGATRSIICTADDKGVVGYSCFFTEFAFDENGNFVAIGVWE